MKRESVKIRFYNRNLIVHLDTGNQHSLSYQILVHFKACLLV